MKMYKTSFERISSYCASVSWFTTRQVYVARDTIGPAPRIRIKLGNVWGSVGSYALLEFRDVGNVVAVFLQMR